MREFDLNYDCNCEISTELDPLENGRGRGCNYKKPTNQEEADEKRRLKGYYGKNIIQEDIYFAEEPKEILHDPLINGVPLSVLLNTKDEIIPFEEKYNEFGVPKEIEVIFEKIYPTMQLVGGVRGKRYWNNNNWKNQIPA